MKYFLLSVAALGLLYVGLRLQPNNPAGLPLTQYPGPMTEHIPTSPPNSNEQEPPAPSETDFITVAEAIQHSQRYNHTQQCLRGYYETTFEFSALASEFQADDKQRNHIVKPYIWIATEVPRDQLQCAAPGQGLYCFGLVTVCGNFEVADPGQPGFGQLGLYRFQLR